MLAAPTSLTTGTGSTSPLTTASVTPTANALVICIVYATAAGSFIDTATMDTRGGCTWTKRAAALSADGKQYLALFTAQPASPTASTQIINLSQSSTESRWVILQMTHSAAAAYQNAGAAAQASSNSPSMSMTALNDPTNARICAWGTLHSALSAPRSGWTEITDVAGTAISLETQHLLGSEETMSCSYTGAVVSIGIWIEIVNDKAWPCGGDIDNVHNYDDNADVTVTPGNTVSGWNVGVVPFTMHAFDQFAALANATELDPVEDDRVVWGA